MSKNLLKKLATANSLIRIPNKFPNDYLLKQLTFPEQGAFTQPRLGGKPLVNARNQAKLRQVCQLAGIQNPEEAIGLPPLEENKDLKVILPKGKMRPVELYKKKVKIAQNMHQMESRIQKWEEEKLKGKASNKSFLPF